MCLVAMDGFHQRSLPWSLLRWYVNVEKKKKKKKKESKYVNALFIVEVALAIKLVLNLKETI